MGLNPPHLVIVSKALHYLTEPPHVYSHNRAPKCSLPAVDSYWTILTKLLLGFVHLADEINEAFTGLWHTLKNY